jgi:hypothetical protein
MRHRAPQELALQDKIMTKFTKILQQKQCRTIEKLTFFVNPNNEQILLVEFYGNSYQHEKVGDKK